MSTVAILTIHFYEESAQLKRVALLASSFFIENSTVRMEYLKDIDDFVNMIHSKITSSLYSLNDKSQSLLELRYERENTEREYQKLRQGDYTKYLTTDIFEEHGMLKYMPVAAGIISGTFQAYAGYRLTHFGQKSHIKHLKTVGLTLIAHGSNNVYEAVSPLLYEGRQQSGWLRDIYRGIASMMGYSDNQGDLGYAISDFSLTTFAAFRKPVLMESPHRLVSKGMLESSRTNKLFYYMNKDYKSKFYASSMPIKLFLVGKSGYNLYATFNNENYLFDKER